MSSLDTILISAITALCGVIAFLYLDKSKEAKAAVKALLERDERGVKASAERDEKFLLAIKAADDGHQRQEDELHQRHEKAMQEMVSDHKREMSGMVDRAIEAFRNDKDHDRDERRRILELAESLERRAQWRGGRGT